MVATALRALLLAGLSVAAAFAPAEEWQQLEIVPVRVATRPQLPRFIRAPSGATILCDSTNGKASSACQKIFEKNLASNPDDEDWAYGDGYYSTNWPDIDENADVGVLNMPYDLDNDLLGAHIASISGVEPCGGCDN
eukprot:CAMPEP_0173380084 /NCGR_PEP_ID=MMETSP1356-20130122/2849_1 /TAXON_ID=77927 ORGANISM="Hemiselmis virescens, Strain PCC157" /NCGR_SAMPLE_ID=MMETSP1356 /ASSEMBLY_ACC=CAM_ASM_000847 /LENGTH=136 /DNA_ID=CAMNT_0014333573 /DNA_START=9 /DNA_END=419 /DNA_ORIENTATION=-